MAHESLDTKNQKPRTRRQEEDYTGIMSEPNSLDKLLAFVPIPYFSERSAGRVAAAWAENYERRDRMSTKDDVEKNHLIKLVVARYGFVGGGILYGASQIYSSIQ